MVWSMGASAREAWKLRSISSSIRDASQVRMSLAFDAGVIDLLSASEFLGALKGFVEDPSLILSV